MNTEEPLAIELFCTHLGVEHSFVVAMQERGLVEIIVIEQRRYIAPEHLPRLEKLARMHYDLEINYEGLEALSHMLERMEALQVELTKLRDRLGRYEDL